MSDKNEQAVYPAIAQSFDVRFDYPVLFVREVFDPANPGLLEVFDRLHEGRRPKVAICLDDGLAAARPGLAGAVTSYFHAHSDRLEAAGAPIFFPGGHEAKTGPRHLQNLIWTLGNLHVDRQSFVLAIGGGRQLA